MFQRVLVAATLLTLLLVSTTASAQTCEEALECASLCTATGCEAGCRDITSGSERVAYDGVMTCVSMYCTTIERGTFKLDKACMYKNCSEHLASCGGGGNAASGPLDCMALHQCGLQCSDGTCMEACFSQASERAQELMMAWATCATHASCPDMGECATRNCPAEFNACNSN